MAKRLEIINHFDSLIDEVELKAEKLLKKYPLLEDEDDTKYRNVINKRRMRFIDELDAAKKFNLANLTENSDGDDEHMNKAAIFVKYCFNFDKYDMVVCDYASEDDDNHNEHDHDCQHNSLSANEDRIMQEIDETFGYFIVLNDGFLPQHEFELFQELLYYGNEINEDLIDDRERLETKFYKRLQEADTKSNSSIFDANLTDIMVILKLQLFLKKAKFSCLNSHEKQPINSRLPLN